MLLLALTENKSSSQSPGISGLQLKSNESLFGHQVDRLRKEKVKKEMIRLGVLLLLVAGLVGRGTDAAAADDGSLLIRFGSAINLDPSDVEMRSVFDGYNFWALKVNEGGGIQVLPGRFFKVEMMVVDDGKDAKRHEDGLRRQVEENGAHFLLGSLTSFANEDSKVAAETKTITMTCCHGPPAVYEQSAEDSKGILNYLFGIHVNSETYPLKFLQMVGLMERDTSIGMMVTMDEEDPYGKSLFTYSTFLSAKKLVDALRKDKGLPLRAEQYVLPLSQVTNATHIRGIVADMKNNSHDLLMGFTLGPDGQQMMLEVEEQKVSTRGVFVTVAPTSATTVRNLTSLGIDVEYVTSAGQWHPGANFIDSGGDALWPDARTFAREMEAYLMEETGERIAASYTHASAAAACTAIQKALENAFFKCQLQDPNFSSFNDLLAQEVDCEGETLTESGFDVIHRALRNLRSESFFGDILFDGNQRNFGRSSLTLQLQGETEEGLNKAKIFESSIFGPSVYSTTLVQEAVLPDDVQTALPVYPRPIRPGVDLDICPSGEGSDEFRVCRACNAGEYRLSLSDGGFDYNCEECDTSSYSATARSSRCTFCPYGSGTLQPGAVSETACVCREGFYKEYSDDVSCTECPVGAACPGSDSTILAKPGYWVDAYFRSDGVYVQQLIQCFPASDCPQTDGQTCDSGLGGNVCSWCGFDNGNKDTPNYFSLFGSCTECYGKSADFFLHIAIYITWIIMNIVLAEHYTAFKIGFDWMQIMSFIGIINAGWPNSVNQYFDVATLFAFDLDIVSWSCSAANWDFLKEMIIQFSLPFCLALFWMLITGVQIILRKAHRIPVIGKWGRKWNNSSLVPGTMHYRVRRILIFLGFTDGKPPSSRLPLSKILLAFEATYQINSYYALSSLSTENIGGKEVLSSAPYYQQDTSVIAVGVTGLIILSIFFPLFLLIRLASFAPQPKKIKYGKDEKIHVSIDHGHFLEAKNQESYGFLFEMFRVELWPVSLFHFLHRFVQIILIVMISDADIAIYCSLAWNLVFLLFFMVKNPSNEEKVNVCHKANFFSILIMLLTGAFFSLENQRMGISGALHTFIQAAIDRACKKHLPRYVASFRRVEDLITEISPFKIWSWVAYRLNVLEDNIENDSSLEYAEARRELTHFVLLSRSISKLEQKNPCMSVLSLSQEAVLWRKMVLSRPDLLDLLYVNPDGAQRHYLSFFKVYYKHFWHPDRKLLFSPPRTVLAWYDKFMSALNRMRGIQHEHSGVAIQLDDVSEEDFQTIYSEEYQSTIETPESEGMNFSRQLSSKEIKALDFRTPISSTVTRPHRARISYWLVRHKEDLTSRIAFDHFMYSIIENKNTSLCEKMAQYLLFKQRSEFKSRKMKKLNFLDVDDESANYCQSDLSHVEQEYIVLLLMQQIHISPFDHRASYL
eukprot:jgi/Picsp_1/2317/NSC_05780-R1_extracellular ligand-binding receptor